MSKLISLIIIITGFWLSTVVHGQDEIYTFKPESRHLDVNPYGSDNLLGFYSAGNETVFGACYFKCEDFSGSYMIYDNDTDIPDDPQKYPSYFLPASSNVVKSCAFSILRWTKDVPRYWEITVYDNTTAKNYSEIITVNFYLDVEVLIDSSKTVLPLSTYFQRVISPVGVNFSKCQILYYTSKGVNTTIDLDMNSYKATFSPDDPEMNKRLSSVGNGFCGYKMSNAQANDPSITFIVTDENDEQYREQYARVTVIDLDEMYGNRTQIEFVSSDIKLLCGTPNVQDPLPQRFCLLYNPKGELVSEEERCVYRIPLVLKEDFGTWRCTIAHEGSMDVLEFTTELQEKEKEKVDVYSEDKNTALNIGCILKNYDNPEFKYCFFTRPDGEELVVNLGSATERYSTFTSNFINGVCGMEILKPLLDEEKGTWKCTISHFTEGLSGGYISVEKETSIPHKQRSKVVVNLDDSFVIDCQVPFNSDFCYITSPNGSFHQPDQFSTLSYGRCSLTVDKAESIHSGKWNCNFAQASGLPNVVVPVELSIADLKLIYADSEVDEGEDAELICNTAGVPIEYCVFESPKGESFYLTKSESKSNKISYYGRGIGYGDCGIKIKSATSADGGKWKCHVSVGYQVKTEMTGDMLLAVADKSPILGSAGSLGISIGVVAAAAIIAGLIYNQWRKRRNHQNTPENNAPRTSNDSAEGIIQGRGNTYEATSEF